MAEHTSLNNISDDNNAPRRWWKHILGTDSLKASLWPIITNIIAVLLTSVLATLLAKYYITIILYLPIWGTHMCPLKLLPLNYRDLRPHQWPLCA
jgi:hypothetical protein